MITLAFIIFVVVLAAILVIVALLLDPVMAIFIVSLIACLMLTRTKHKKLDDQKTLKEKA